MPKSFAALLCFFILLMSQLHAQSVDTINIVSHDQTFVVTDPSKGFNDYPVTTAFPSDSVDYRKVRLWVTYACPDGQRCGQWDYIDHLFLRTTDTATGESRDIELARIISPYGWGFDSTWSFTWHTDVSDFSHLLHDSVEIVFRHTGYESNEDRGWLITLDFEIITGRPPAKFLGMDSLWCGRFDFGDSSKPIEQFLKPIKLSHPEAAYAKLRIVQTGHGMDDSANCAEFCPKWRRVIFDDSLIEQKDIWRECGDNPLYPQAGTWIFDRAGWCPGSLVQPDEYILPLTKGKEHTVDIDMQPYINPNKPSANYWIYAYLFYYEEPWAEYDISIEDVIVPSTLDEYSRLNPDGQMIRFILKNNGKKEVDGLTIQAKQPRRTKFLLVNRWFGQLPPLELAEIDVPLWQSKDDAGTGWELTVTPYINGSYTESAKIHQQIIQNQMPVILKSLILSIRTNMESIHNSISLTRENDTVLHREDEDLLPTAIYNDTIELEIGVYNLIVTDTAGDGLSFWFNPEGGHGYVRLLDMEGRLIKDFNPDFGNGINYWFEASDGAQAQQGDTLLADIFPPRNDGKFNLFLFNNYRNDVVVEIISDSTGATVFNHDYESIKDTILPVDLGDIAVGRYEVRVKSAEQEVTCRLRIISEQ